MFLQSPFSSISSTGVDAHVLRIVVRAENQQFTAGEVFRMLDGKVSLSAVRKSLERLAEVGTFKKHTLGKTSGYQFNQDHLFADAFRTIAGAKNLLIQRLKSLIDGWEYQPQAVYLFGSAARNEMKIDSDVDVVFLFATAEDAEKAEGAIFSLAQEASSWLGNVVNPLIFSAEDLDSSPVFSEILKDGLHIWGARNFLRTALRRSIQ